MPENVLIQKCVLRMEDDRMGGRRASLETIRPWRKRTVQIISTEKWKKECEVTPLPQVSHILERIITLTSRSSQ